jgi:5-methylthioadenosine/S-adenosylhomocysteine deaminase
MADTILAGGLVDVGDGEFERGDIVIDGATIAAVGPGAGGDRQAAGAAIVDCARFAIVPGLVNAHTHSNEGWFRGRWDNLPLEPWMLFSYPALAGPPQSPREVYVRTLLGALDMVHSGATCTVDFVYEQGGVSGEALDAVVQAYRDVGLRALVALGMSDLAYHETVALEETLVPASLLEQLERKRPPAWDEWEAFARDVVARHHRPDEGITIGLAPSGPQRCSDAFLRSCAGLADELDLQIHIHVLETRMQAVAGQRMYGATLPEHMSALGFLGPRVSCAHGIWLTDSDIGIVRDAGSTVVHNPISNMKLGSGICPVPLLLEHGVNVALGTDGMASNDGNDMFAVLKIAGLLHKLWDVDYERWLGAHEAWRMATAGGARAAGEPDRIGRLEPGRQADLLLLDLDSRVFTPLSRPLHNVVFGSTASAVHSSMVGGRWILRDGAVTGLDEPAILAEARDLAPGIFGRHDEAWALGEQLLASLRAGWRQARVTDVGVARTMPLTRPEAAEDSEVGSRRQ